MLSQGGIFDLQTCVNQAALYGYMDIVKFFLNLEYNYDYDVIMDRAAEGGHMDIVKLMIQKGATAFKRALNGAEKGGHQEIIELLKQKSR